MSKLTVRVFHKRVNFALSLHLNTHKLGNSAVIVKSAHNETKNLKGGLYLVATPIGNLEDITLRAIRVLKQSDLILVEDTRHSGRLLNYLNVETPMLSYHKFNSASRKSTILKRLESGEVVSLISDAGMPAISDPGSELVAACVENRVPVTPIPGSCALVAAMAASGLPTQQFTFLGFLPEKSSGRKKFLSEVVSSPFHTILYVSSHKFTATLEDCIEIFGPERKCIVARELTKLHEEFWRSTLQQTLEEFSSREPKGEFTVILVGTDSSSQHLLQMSKERIEAVLVESKLSGLSQSEATKRIVAEFGVKRNEVYKLALDIWDDEDI